MAGRGLKRALLLACIVLAAAGPAHGWDAQPRPRWLPKVWWAIGMCETGLNWTHRTRDYQGAFGFYAGSWDAFAPAGFPAEAYLASPRQQLVVARRIHARYGFTGWGCWTHGGYRVWMARVR